MTSMMGTATSKVDQLDRLVAVLADPSRTKQMLTELREATRVHDEAAAKAQIALDKLKTKAAENDAREAALQTQEAYLDRDRAALQADRNRLTADTVALAQAREGLAEQHNKAQTEHDLAIQAFNREMAEAHAAWEDERRRIKVDLDREASKLHARIAAANARDAELTKISADLSARENALAAKEADYKRRIDALAALLPKG